MAIVDPLQLAERVVVGIVEAVGLELVLKLIFARTPEDRVRAILDAEYGAARQEVDREARAEFLGPVAP